MRSNGRYSWPPCGIQGSLPLLSEIAQRHGHNFNPLIRLYHLAMSDQRRAYVLGTWSMRYVSVRYSASVAAQSKLCGVLAVHLLIRHSWMEGNSEGKTSCTLGSDYLLEARAFTCLRTLYSELPSF